MRYIYQITGAILLLCAPLLSQEKPVNEDEMFSSTDMVIDSKTLMQKEEERKKDEEKKKISVSGEITSANPYYLTRNSVSDFSHEGNQFNPYIDGVLLVDIRLPNRVKAFGNFQADYNARSNQTTYDMKEMFVDFNIGQKVYFRTGRQVLQWGRCYLWNPTDMINVEKKMFLQKIGSREGAYGLKAHAAFGTMVNMYGFADTSNAEDVNRVGGACKLECLFGSTEMAVSVWGKKGYKPVAGYDFSTRLFGIDVVGETAVSHGSNTGHVVEKSGVLYAERDNGWKNRTSIDFGHAFDFNDQPKKIQVNLEFFYNGEGRSGNDFSDKNKYAYDRDVTIQNIDGTKVTIPAGVPVADKATYMAGRNIYQPNYYSKYYAAVFTTINKFITSDFSLPLNFITNIQQRSYIVSCGIAYADINDFKAAFYINGFFGGKNTEYTYSNYAVELLITAGIVF